ncbi:hypothetical protein [Actinomadura chokoriensis]|uniref:hypothetical protein n=1 Tax=Actinomadura chokoriensis TaxID=454156 RepID=UPI0031F7A281
MTAPILVLTGAIAVAGDLAREDSLDFTGSRVALAVVALLALVGIFVGGVLAFTGRWRSWYSGGWQANYKPLAAPWFAGGFLLMAALVGLDALFDAAPLPLMVTGLVLVLVCVVLGVIYAIHPPRCLLPRWIRAVESDPLGVEGRTRPAADRALSRWKSWWSGSGLRKWLLIGVLCAALPMGFFYLSRPLWWYATGTSATATVEGCGHSSTSRNRVCWGEWTLPGGGRGHGRITGAGEDDVGDTVEVRASATHAVTLTFGLVASPLVLFFFASGSGYGVYRRRAARKQDPAAASP